jgi:signal peptidase II
MPDGTSVFARLCQRYQLHCDCPKVRTAYTVLLALFVVVLDFLSKRWVEAHLAFGEFIPVTGFFNLVLAHNTGAAFSFLAGAGGWQNLFFMAVAVVACVVMLVLIYRNTGNILFIASLGLILGGALGNLIDRVMLGHVVDFLDFHLGGWHWPAFNVADSAITVGTVLLVWDGFKKS